MASIIDVMPTALSRFADPSSEFRLLPSQAPPGGIDHLVVWLVDGLGYDQVTQALAMGLMPHLRERLQRAPAHIEPLQTVNPSMTPVALASLLTGSDPAAHGVLGQVLYYEGMAVNVFHDEIPDAFELATPTIAEMAEGLGIHYQAVLEHRILNGPLTRLLHRHTSNISTYIRDSGLATVLNTELAHSPPGIIYLYSSGIDAVNHRRGAYHAEWQAEIQAIDRHLGDLSGPPGQASWLWITADHGHVPVIDQLAYQALLQQISWLPLRPAEVGGAISVNVEDMKELEHALDQIKVPVEVVPLSRYIESGYFGQGDLAPFVARLGSHLLVPSPGYSWSTKDATQSLCWTHGGSQPIEMTVPWIELRLS